MVQWLDSEFKPISVKKILEQQVVFHIQKPMKRIILLDNLKHYISLPYLVFFYRWGRLYVYGSIEYPSIDTDLYLIGFGNMESNGQICLGLISYREIFNPDHLLDLFWLSEFTYLNFTVSQFYAMKNLSPEEILCPAMWALHPIPSPIGLGFLPYATFGQCLDLIKN